ncbi:MAG TPA: hypothetical protein VHG53_01715 [Candidatus Limnocylindria bacterium]|nr:hypothetical protein [Candidatus Limnocylindria bacterium]
MARWLAAAVFALAAGSAALSGSGLAVAPHAHAPGTPSYHDHLLVAYRYPLYLLQLKLLAHPAPGPRWSLGGDATGAGASLVFGLLVFAAARLPRPSRRAVADVAPPRIARPQWRPARIHGPPRPVLLAHA